jgi:hypothetical protein
MSVGRKYSAVVRSSARTRAPSSHGSARSAYRTDVRTSFEGALTPQAFRALTRTK